jgi:hypothetical protein
MSRRLLLSIAISLAVVACGDKVDDDDDDGDDPTPEGQTPGDCDDEADNDDDGLIDCDDDGCFGAPACDGGGDGTDGADGTDGTDGADGADGTDGTDGGDDIVYGVLSYGYLPSSDFTDWDIWGTTSSCSGCAFAFDANFTVTFGSGADFSTTVEFRPYADGFEVTTTAGDYWGYGTYESGFATWYLYDYIDLYYGYVNVASSR